MAKKSEIWRDYAAQAQIIADLRTDLKASDARCVRLIAACNEWMAAYKDLMAIHNNVNVQCDKLLKMQDQNVQHLKADAAAWNDVAEQARARVAAAEAQDAAKEGPAA